MTLLLLKNLIGKLLIAMNKCRSPKIPPLFVNNVYFELLVKKRNLSTICFQNSADLLLISVLPPLNLLTDKKIDHISIQCDDITSLIRNLNPNKATGSDEISGQILLLCDNSVDLPQNNFR